MKALTFLTLIFAISSANAVQLYTGGIYSQNFDTLPSSGTSSAFANDTTLNGWFAFQSGTGSVVGRDTSAGWAAMSTIFADAGLGQGRLCSYGASNNTERAFGGINTGNTGDHVYALVLQNTSGSTYTDFTMSFTGEQWRAWGTNLQKLEFDYEVLSTFSLASSVADLRADNTATYTSVASGNFTSLATSVGGTAVDGNATGNRTLESVNAQPLTWNDGDYLVLRWWDENETGGKNHGLALDDFSFSANAAPVPEPASIAAVGIGLAAIIRRKKRLAR